MARHEVADQDTRPAPEAIPAPAFLIGLGPRPALHLLLSLCHLLQPAGARKTDLDLDRPPEPGRRPEPDTRGTRGRLAPPTHPRRTPPRPAPPASYAHAERVTGLVEKCPLTPGAPRAGSGVRTPLQRPQAQSAGVAPCPLPFSAGNNRVPSFWPTGSREAAGKDRPPQAMCSTVGVQGRRWVQGFC